MIIARWYESSIVSLGKLRAGPGDAQAYCGSLESIGSIDPGRRPAWRWHTGGVAGAGLAGAGTPEKLNGAGEEASKVLRKRSPTTAVGPWLGSPVILGGSSSIGSGYVKGWEKLALPWIALGSLGPPGDEVVTKGKRSKAPGLSPDRCC